MPKYETEWKDYKLPTGQDFAVAVCGYSNRVRHMTFGQDPLRKLFVQSVVVEENENCSSADHCLATDCPLNHTEGEHLAHMLDMNEDEAVDEETSKMWGADTAVGCLVAMAKRISDEMAVENKDKAK